MKFLFTYLTDSFSLLENPIDDYVIMAVIGVIAYAIAYHLVGSLYRFDLIDGRGAGHFLHWIIRLAVFVIIFYVTATAIRIHTWFHALPSYKWWIIVSVIGAMIVGVAIVKYLIARRGRSEG